MFPCIYRVGGALKLFSESFDLRTRRYLLLLSEENSVTI